MTHDWLNILYQCAQRIRARSDEFRVRRGTSCVGNDLRVFGPSNRACEQVLSPWECELRKAEKQVKSKRRKSISKLAICLCFRNNYAQHWFVCFFFFFFFFFFGCAASKNRGNWKKCNVCHQNLQCRRTGTFQLLNCRNWQRGENRFVYIWKIKSIFDPSLLFAVTNVMMDFHEFDLTSHFCGFHFWSVVLEMFWSLICHVFSVSLFSWIANSEIWFMAVLWFASNNLSHDLQQHAKPCQMHWSKQHVSFHVGGGITQLNHQCVKTLGVQLGSLFSLFGPSSCTFFFFLVLWASRIWLGFLFRSTFAKQSLQASRSIIVAVNTHH